MGVLYLRKRPDACREQLARGLKAYLETLGVHYHIRTLKRQLTGTTSTVAAEVEEAMKYLLLRLNGIKTTADIEKALVSAGLSVSAKRRTPKYVSTARLLPLSRLWMLRNPGRSRRSLALEIVQRLAKTEAPLKIGPVQVVLAGRRPTARREILEVLLELLSDQNIASESEARAHSAESVEAIASYEHARTLTPAEDLVRLGLAWKVYTREPSSRRLAAILHERLVARKFDISLARIQHALEGNAKNVRAVLITEMEAVLRAALPEGEDVSEAVVKAVHNTSRVVDLHWVDAKPIRRLAREWLAAHPRTSMRQLAMRVAKTARRMGYATSANTIQPILGGHKNRTRGFIYRAMLEQLPAHRERVPLEHVIPSCWTKTALRNQELTSLAIGSKGGSDTSPRQRSFSDVLRRRLPAATEIRPRHFFITTQAAFGSTPANVDQMVRKRGVQLPHGYYWPPRASNVPAAAWNLERLLDWAELRFGERVLKPWGKVRDTGGCYIREADAPGRGPRRYRV